MQKESSGGPTSREERNFGTQQVDKRDVTSCSPSCGMAIQGEAYLRQAGEGCINAKPPGQNAIQDVTNFN